MLYTKFCLKCLVEVKKESRDFESNSALFYHLNFLPPFRRVPFFCLNKHYDALSSVIYNLDGTIARMASAITRAL